MSHPAFPGGVHREDPELSHRQRQVFLALVTLHGDSARPVGSEALSQQGGIPLSPASIRGALAELEAAGLVARAHASAGRVPSETGYDFFIRHLLTPAALAPAELAQVDETLGRSARDVEHLLGEASRLLSSLTHQLGLALTTSLEGERLTGLELQPLDARRALMIMSLGAGVVRTLVLELESPLDGAELDEVSSVLRERLIGRDLAEVRDRLAADPELVRWSAVRMVARAAAAHWATGPSARFSSGAGHIAGQPEFAAGAALGSLLRIVEQGPPLDRLMVEGAEGHSAVRVGLDEDEALHRCSLVSYPLPGVRRGAVGVLGPLRMDYARVISIVDVVGRRVAELL
ncbi:MAG: heat-inducible transcription repressor HrcA [Candidatus Eisenbacteria bacterium]|uniref:Heat-inducible transcription repressor HrcA n=1 Tax=Eiseniibacteriota bacterium TaxID=2212470 RepID=A0A9D6L7F4_UNCEI|nr:heat-inducible transcription repressor HrcA [Candidatus Eisenbacteria bacterium]